MAALKCTCPACNVVFEADPLGAAVCCPVCDHRFPPDPEPEPVVVVDVPEASGAAPAGESRLMIACLAALAALLLLGCAAAVALSLPAERHPSRKPVVEAAAAEPPAEPEPEPPPEPDPEESVPEVESAPPLRPVRPMRPPTPESTQSLPERVNKAIDRGTAYLRQHAQGMQQPVQYEGLLGLTLLECGVPRNDPAVQRIATSLRNQARGMNKTYVLATSIYFFDRLRMPQDQPLIVSMANRLIDGQSEDGSWTYFCPLWSPPPPQVGQRPGPPGLITGYTGYSGALPPQQRPGAGGPARPARLRTSGDHSNTQFATLALWIARRHGVDVRPALQRVELHFREVQRDDGSWGYHRNTPVWRVPSTCAGLLGLAAGHGVDAGRGRDSRVPLLPALDGRLFAGLKYLGNAIASAGQGQELVGRTVLEGRDDLYSLWSIERTAVIWNITRIGEREWYPWAAEWLVEVQEPDGSWRNNLGREIDTCFALLILKRTNLVPDLTVAMRDLVSPAARKTAAPGPVMIAKPRPPAEEPPVGFVERPGAAPARTPDPQPGDGLVAPPAVPPGRVQGESAGNPEGQGTRTPR